MADVLPPIPYDQPQTSFEWIDWYTKLKQVVDTAGLDHNGLINLQGGQSGQYYHLNSAQHSGLTGGGSTTLHSHSIYEQTANKNAVSGYAGLNASSRTTKGVDTTDDVIVDDATNGLVLKDTQGTPHYWRVTVSNAGALVITDLGTTKP